MKQINKLICQVQKWGFQKDFKILFQIFLENLKEALITDAMCNINKNLEFQNLF